MPKHRGTHDPSPGPSWRFTKVMNMSDLSRDDDFLSHLFVEKLGTGSVPLFVHKMDSSRRLPKTDTNDILQIVRRLVATKAPPSVVIREAVESLLLIRPIRYYLSGYMEKQVNAFATHASRYLELYLPNGSIEIAHTSRYAHATGKSELCILATRPLAPGTVITELKGSMADLTDEEDRELKCATATGQSGIRRDFSVIHSKQLKKNHLFLGPARFVNHDCGNNAELFREGRYITFRVIKPIGVGDEVTAHYGDDYFGRNNRHCLCQTCEDAGKGGYTPEEGMEPPSDSDSEVSDRSSQRTKDRESTAPLNVNERRTRRGVYAVMPEDQIKERERSTIPKIELDAEDSLLSLTFPSPSATSDGTLLETPQLSRESSTMSRETSKSDAVVRISKRLRVRPPKPSSLNPGPSRLATPEGRLRSSSRGRTSVTETLEQRVLRPRASDLGTGKNPSGKGEKPSQQANPTKKPVPKGVPTCVICKGILPVISVDSEIVWGLEGYDEKGKRLKGKKTSSLECPRCMRHREIYNVSWPYRLVSHGGTAYPTPPPVDPPVTSSLAHSSKPRQESQEVSMSRTTSSKATSKNRRDDEDQRPTKRKKVEADVEPLPLERSRSGRPHIPSRKLRESTEDCEKSILPPQKSSQVIKISSKQKETQKETAPQPPKKSRAERAVGRSKVREQLEKAHTTMPHPSTIAKTPAAGAEDGMVLHSTSSRKRPRIEEHVPVKRSSSVEAAEASEVIASMAPRPSLSGMRAFRKGGYSGSLGVAPNPMNLARRNWVPMVTDSDPSDDLIPNPDTPPRAESSSSSITEDSLQLITPHDSDGPNHEASGETEGVQATRRPRAFLSQSMKPSPVNFAMRRWSSMGSPKSDRSETDSQDELDEPIPRTSASTIVDITLRSAPENTRRPSARYTTPEPRSYVPSRIWETGGDSRAPPESPDSSLFVLRHKATFTSSPGAGSFTDDSERMVERLVYADSPSRDDMTDVQQVIDATAKVNGLSRIDAGEVVSCVLLENQSPQLTKVSLPTIQTTAFATVSAASKLVKVG